MAGLSFTTSGAVPSFGIPSQGTSGSTQAVGGANTNLGAQIGTALKNNQNSGFPSTSSPAANALNSAVAPSTPVKSQTTTSPDGTVNSVTYHPPATGSNSSSSGTNAGVLPKAPVAPLAVAPAPSQPYGESATGNPYTGSTANNPTVGQGYQTSNSNPYSATNVNGANGLPPNSQFQSSSSATQPMNTNPGVLSSTTFPGIVSGLATTSAAGSPTAQYYEGQTGNYGAGNIPIGQTAEQIAANAGQQMANVGEKGAQFEGGQLTTGTSPVAEGNATITANTTANEQQAIAQGAQTALQGTAQALTGQNQAAGASNEAAGQANTAQANTQSGLASAGSLSAPTSNFPFSFNPQTGQFTNAASGASGGALTYNPTTDSATLAKEVISGSIPYSDAVSAMGYAPGVGTGLLQQAIVQRGGNIAQLEGQATGTTAAAAAPGQAAATNIGTAGTVGTTTAAQGVQQSTQAYVNANTAYTQATGQSANLQTAMQGINGINSQYANTAINALQGQFGSAKYTGFITSLNEAKQAYTNLLSSVGASTPTVNGQQATDIFNSASTPNQINAAIRALNDAAYAKLKPLYDQIGTYQSQLNSGGSTSSTSGGNYSVGSTVTTSAGGFTLTPNGWVSNPK